MTTTMASEQKVHPTTCPANQTSSVTAKLDRRIVPLLFVLFMLSFLDRANIGHAKIFGLEDDLHLTPTQYAWSLSIFFIGYIVFEIPSNLMLKRTSPPLWFAIIVVVWGGTMVGMAFVTGANGLLATRFVLGVFEAGLFPGITYYLRFWYTREEQGTRLAYIIAALLFSGAFGGLISYGMGMIDGYLNLRGWQWIFLIEGSFTVLVGLITWFLLPKDPESVTWLKDDEKELLLSRLRANFVESKGTKFEPKEFVAGLLDYKTYLLSVAYFGFAASIYSISLTMPTLIKSMGFTTMDTILLTIPPYLLAIPFSVAVARNSDRTMQRAYHIIFLCLVGMVGYVIQLATTSFVGRYIGIFLSLCGCVPCTPIVLAWSTNNTRGATKSATTSAMVIMLGNFSGVAAGQLYWPGDAPNYVTSNAINLGLMGLTALCSALLRMLLARENCQLDLLELQLPTADLTLSESCAEASKIGYRYVL